MKNFYGLLAIVLMSAGALSAAESDANAKQARSGAHGLPSAKDVYAYIQKHNKEIAENQAKDSRLAAYTLEPWEKQYVRSEDYEGVFQRSGGELSWAPCVHFEQWNSSLDQSLMERLTQKVETAEVTRRQESVGSWCTVGKLSASAANISLCFALGFAGRSFFGDTFGLSKESRVSSGVWGLGFAGVAVVGNMVSLYANLRQTSALRWLRARGLEVDLCTYPVDSGYQLTKLQAVMEKGRKDGLLSY